MVKDSTESYGVYFPFLAYARLYDSNLMGTGEVFLHFFRLYVWKAPSEGVIDGLEKKIFFFL